MNKIPKSWRIVPLSDSFILIRGVSYKKDESSNTIKLNYKPILRATNIQNGNILFQDLVYANSDNISDVQLLKRGDIVIAMSSGSKNIVGKAAQIKINWEGSFGAFCSVARPYNGLDKKYIGYFFQTNYYRETISKLSGGININNIRQEFFNQIKIPLPPIQEQNRISNKLDSLFENIISIHNRLDQFPEIIENFKQSILHQSVTGVLTKDWRKKNRIKKSWRKVLLKNHSIKIGSGSTPRGGQSVYLKSGVPLIRSMNVHFQGFKYVGLAYINKKQAYELRNVTVKKGDVLLNITGASIGRVCQVPSNMNGARVNQHVCIIRTKSSISQSFLNFYLASPQIQKFIETENYGATRQALTKIMIENFVIPLPEKNEQKEIVKRINKYFSIIYRITKKYEKIVSIFNELPNQILVQAFSGKLVKQYPKDEPVEQLLERVKEEKIKIEEQLKSEKKKRVGKKGKKLKMKEGKHLDLFEIIKSYSKGINVEDLLNEAQYSLNEIDEFYKNLKAIRNIIVEVKPKNSKIDWPNKSKVLLKIKD